VGLAIPVNCSFRDSSESPSLHLASLGALTSRTPILNIADHPSARLLQFSLSENSIQRSRGQLPPSPRCRPLAPWSSTHAEHLEAIPHFVRRRKWVTAAFPRRRRSPAPPRPPPDTHRLPGLRTAFFLPPTF